MTLTAGPCRNSYVERRASVACMCACVVRGSASRVVLVTEGKAQPLPLPLPPLHPRPRPPGGVAARMRIYPAPVFHVGHRSENSRIVAKSEGANCACRDPRLVTRSCQPRFYVHTVEETLHPPL